MNKTAIVAIVVAAVAVPVGVYAASPLFTNTVVNEPLPEVAGGDKMMEDNMMQDADMEEKPLTGSFAGAGDGIHSAEGVARVIQLEDGSQVLRFEDFKVTNGPDLYVYLATDNQASDFVDLGMLKGNVGSQNYDIPKGTDLSKYDTVVIWCKSFSVFFGGAGLTASA